jgi:hypothetical protein
MKLHTVLATAWFLGGSFLPAPFALAGEALLCDGVIDSGTLDNVIIPEDGDCTLEGDALVEGDVYADGAVDVIIDGITVDGNVRIKNSTGNIAIINVDIGGDVILTNNTLGEILVVTENTIDGNVRLMENVAAGRLYVGSCGLGGNTVGRNITVIDNTAQDVTVNCSNVDGDVTMKDNTATLFDVQVRGNPDARNSIGGNLRMLNNTAEKSQVLVKDNRIEGDLICSGNDPDVTLATTRVDGKEICFD